MELKPPTTTVLYDYPRLAEAISIWKSMDESKPWVGVGYASCSPTHKGATSSRQWDSSSSVLDDELEENTARIIDRCMDSIESVERALIMYGNCGVKSRWVEEMEPARAQIRYEQSLLNLALMARQRGVDV